MSYIEQPAIHRARLLPLQKEKTKNAPIWKLNPNTKGQAVVKNAT